jgi:hypothetical protein
MATQIIKGMLLGCYWLALSGMSGQLDPHRQRIRELRHVEIFIGRVSGGLLCIGSDGE